MSQRDKRQYDATRADPVRYAAYLERKRREQKARRATGDRREYERLKMKRWRVNNAVRNAEIRAANHAVEAAIKAGRLVRPGHCSHCGKPCNPEAHHFKGYAKEYWLVVEWLCSLCHKAAEHHAEPLTKQRGHVENKEFK